MKRGILLMLLIGLMAGTSQAAITTYHDDLAGFLANSSTTLIDFEAVPKTGGGTIGDDEFELFTAPKVIDGVSFTTTSGYLGVSGKDGTALGQPNGSPFDSALLFADQLYSPIVVEFDAADGITAVGGYFGKLVEPDPKVTHTLMTVLGTSGILYNVELPVLDMGVGEASNFFGWTVTGDTILSVTHSLVPVQTQFGFVIESEWAGLDDLRYGQMETTPPPVVPEPASCIVWSLIGLSCVGAGWWRRRKAA